MIKVCEESSRPYTTYWAHYGLTQGLVSLTRGLVRAVDEVDEAFEQAIGNLQNICDEVLSMLPGIILQMQQELSILLAEQATRKPSYDPGLEQRIASKKKELKQAETFRDCRGYMEECNRQLRAFGVMTLPELNLPDLPDLSDIPLEKPKKGERIAMWLKLIWGRISTGK